jgi:choline dehydrogenase-like flavoprotein
MRWSPGEGVFWRPAPQADGFSAHDRTFEADVVIIGTGPGGAASARTLANLGLSVLLVEEGPPEERFRPNQGAVMRYHMQEGGAMVATGATFMPIAAGRGVGGGTLINSAIAWRCPDSVLAEWATLLGDQRFSADNLRPVYDELWEYLGIWETRKEVSGENNDLVVRGVNALGWDGGYLSRYTPQCVGCGTCYYGCPSGGKASTNHNFLVEAATNGARILADTKITDFLVTGRRVVGVVGRSYHPDTREPGGSVTIRAPKVIVACGGIGTPRLLAGSSLDLGPAVGKGLHVHPGNAVFGVCKQEVKWWQGATQGAYFHPEGLPGVLPHTSSLPPEVALLSLGAQGIRAPDAMEIIPHLAGLLVMISDHSSGTVGVWPDGRAKLTYDFSMDDIGRIKAGMVASAKVLFAGGAEWCFCPVAGVGRIDRPDDLEARLTDRVIQDFTLYASHPMSSCRMGNDPATSVIRPDGRAHTYEGLYLADSSIFPTSLGVNPSVTTMAMATILARGIAQAG